MIQLIFLQVIILVNGFVGIFITRRNLLLILISLEMILLGVNYSFIFASILLDDNIGEVLSLYVLAIAASESAIGLALIVSFYRIRGVIRLDSLQNLKA